jgi:hypothetical protein
MGRDLTELWGWLGIVVGLCCCGILGVVFGALSIREARRRGKSPVLGYVAIAVSALNIIFSAFQWGTGRYPFPYRR